MIKVKIYLRCNKVNKFNINFCFSRNVDLFGPLLNIPNNLLYIRVLEEYSKGVKRLDDSAQEHEIV